MASASVCAFRTTSTFSREKAGRRLVRDHLRKLHGRRRTAAGRARSDSRTIPGRAARRLDVFRLGRAAQPRAPAAAQDAGQAHQNALALRSSVLGQRGRPLHATICCPCPTLSKRPSVTARRRFAQVRDFSKCRSCVENVSSYAEFHASEMTEWEFLNEVVERADCGILLDVNNIYVSSQEPQFRSLRLSEQRPA